MTPDPPFVVTVMVPLELQVDGVEVKVILNCANVDSPLKNNTIIKAINLFNETLLLYNQN
jgi:hypothetical protein